MIKYKDTLKTEYPDIPRFISSLGAESSKTLFLDIETTGLSRNTDHIFLIGCLCFDDAVATMRQWFADKTSDESEMLKDFMSFASRFNTIVTYNGERFDIPFIAARCAAHGLTDIVSDMRSFDMFRLVSSYKNILGLPDCKQKTVELFFGIDRTDVKSGAEVAKLYSEYLETSGRKDLDDLILHNADDVKGLALLSPVTMYSELFNEIVSADPEPVTTEEEIPPVPPEKLPLKVTRAQADTYVKDGKKHTELVVRGHLRSPLPSSVGAEADGCFFQIEQSTVTLKVPVFTGEMKYFYSNYKDYYYLPAEDQAIHKSIASFVDKSRRVQANASNCYTRKEGSFLPQFDVIYTPVFSASYKDRRLFFELTPEMKSSRSEISLYAMHVISHIIMSVCSVA